MQKKRADPSEEPGGLPADGDELDVWELMAWMWISTSGAIEPFAVLTMRADAFVMLAEAIASLNRMAKSKAESEAMNVNPSQFDPFSGGNTRHFRIHGIEAVKAFLRNTQGSVGPLAKVGE